MTKEGAAALLKLGAAHAVQAGWVLAAVAVLALIGCLLLLRAGLRERRRLNHLEPPAFTDHADEFLLFAFAVVILVGAGLAAYHALTFLREPTYWAYLWMIRGGH